MKVQEVIDKLSTFDPNAEVIIEINDIIDNYGYMLKANAQVEWIGDNNYGIIISGNDFLDN